MGINGMMRTGVAGMNAQSNRLSTVADNVANSSTIGYKRADTQFSTLVVSSGRGAYQSGGINTYVRYDISGQGNARVTMRAGDAMINGNGFFRVQDSNGAEYMTRAGSFGRDKDGFLQNDAGFYLLDEKGERIQIKGGATDLIPPEITSQVDMGINLKADEEKLSGEINPDDPKSYHQKKSVTTYDSQGAAVTLDMYFAKTGDNEWKMVVYGDHVADAPAEYTLNFDKNGDLAKPVGKLPLSLNGPDGSQYSIDLNFGADGEKLVTQQGADYAFVLDADGMPTGYYEDFTFSKNGDVMVSYSNGKTVSQAVAGMVTVAAPDRLTVISGTVFQSNPETGGLITGRAGEGPFGDLQTGVLEDSNADIGDELTSMIEAQRNYTANSKVFQTGSELMDVIVNLKR